MRNMKIRFAALFLAMVLFAGIFPTKAAAAESSKPYLIKVNKKMCTVTIYEKDKNGDYTVPVKAMLCSTGAATPLGTFKTPEKYRWRLLMGDVWGQYSTRIVGGVLFHSVWYYEQDPSTLSNRQYNNLGKMVSHGCIRLNVEDVKWIYDNCPLGTTVVIYNSDNPGPLGKPKAVKVSEATVMGYDPTDIWSPNNPYIKKKPVISGAKNKTITYGTKNVKVKETITAKSITGEDITSRLRASITYNGKKVKSVNSKVAGKYKITYKVTDPLGKSAQKSVVYTVVDNVKPVISVSEPLYLAGDKKFTRSELLAGVTAKWHGKAYSTKGIEYTETVVKETEGLKVYQITYTLKTPNGKSGKAKRKIYIDSQAPKITGVKELEFTVESEDGVSGQLDFALLLENISVSDNLSKLAKEDVEVVLTQVEGELYTVTYRAADQAGNETSVSASVRIIQKQTALEDETDPSIETEGDPSSGDETDSSLEGGAGEAA